MAAFDLEEHEIAILREACRAADAIDALQAAVDRDGVLNTSPQGVRAHPALVELRQQRLCFAKLLSALAIPSDDSAGGSYGIRGAVG
ncbi:terminase [Mycobacterium sp. BMJ-28]